MRLTIAIAVAIAAFSLSGCDDTTPGVVTAKYSTDTSYLYKCAEDQWALVVVDDSNQEHGNCVSAKTAAKYAVGDQYPSK